MKRPDSLLRLDSIPTSGVAIRAGRPELADQVEKKTLDAVMAMMDAIIDKEKLDQERIDLIRGNISFIRHHLDSLVNTADTPTDRQMAHRMEKSLELLAKTTQVFSTPIIEEIVAKSDEIERRMVPEDDILDKLSYVIEDTLSRVIISLKEKQKKDLDILLLRKRQMGLFASLLTEHSNLMLAAESSIGGGDRVRLSTRRKESINRSRSVIKANLRTLEKLTEAAPEKEAFQRIKEIFPELFLEIEAKLAAAPPDLDRIKEVDDSLAANLPPGGLYSHGNGPVPTPPASE